MPYRKMEGRDMGRLTSIDGLPVVDAKRPLRLNVTKPDIAKAAADSTKKPDQCAVARACYRELHALEVRVHLTRVYVRTNKNNWVRYLTPLRMKQEIISFDRGGRFEPGEFDLNPCNPTQALGTPRRGGERGSGKLGKRRGYVRVQNVRGGPA